MLPDDYGLARAELEETCALPNANTITGQVKVMPKMNTVAIESPNPATIAAQVTAPAKDTRVTFVDMFN
ncbi:MAG: hypothetical protein PHN51_05025 [Candidatus Nanopelagicales bacterium]|nr:hypothetical protein [Candidatus Nanopelagicales bacterium]